MFKEEKKREKEKEKYVRSSFEESTHTSGEMALVAATASSPTSTAAATASWLVEMKRAEEWVREEEEEEVTHIHQLVFLEQWCNARLLLAFCWRY